MALMLCCGVVAIGCDGNSDVVGGDGDGDVGDGDGDGDDGDGDGDYNIPEIQTHLNLPFAPFDYQPSDLPAHFQVGTVVNRINTPVDNAIRDDAATLGRVLFYDVALSANDTVSCASCHTSDAAFTDTATLSTGFDGGLTGRNSMSLVNIRYYQNGAMFWDERADSLEDQVLMPIQDSVEMGMSLDVLLPKLEALEYYPPLFERAFGDTTVSSERISRALAQFVRANISSSSRYDSALATAGGDPRAPFASFSDAENRGKQLFFAPPNVGGGNCAVCHLSNQGPPGQANPNVAIFMMDQARNNGLSATSVDLGLGEHTGRAEDDGKFKSPSLRNVALTGPFMHDGSLETLTDVVEFYSSGVQGHPNLDNRLQQNNQPQRLNLSEADVAALVAFLETLTDDQFLVDPRFATPFR